VFHARHVSVTKGDVDLPAATPVFSDIAVIIPDVFSETDVHVSGTIQEAVNHTFATDGGFSNETSASLESSFSRRFMCSPTFSTIS